MVFSCLEYETIGSFIPGFVVKLGTIGPPPVAFIPDIVQSHPDNTIFQHCRGLLEHKICFCNVVQGDQMAAFVLFSAEFLCISPVHLFLIDLVAILIIGGPTKGTTESSFSSTSSLRLRLHRIHALPLRELIPGAHLPPSLPLPAPSFSSFPPGSRECACVCGLFAFCMSPLSCSKIIPCVTFKKKPASLSRRKQTNVRRGVCFNKSC
nr:C-type lectin [Pseudocerastes urarachnoides]